MFQRIAIRTTVRTVGLILAVAVLAWSAAEASSSAPLIRRVLSEPSSAAELHVELDNEVHQGLLDAQQAVLAEFPLPGRDAVTLELVAVPAPTTQFVVVDESGQHPAAAPRFRSFRGRIVGEPASVVSLSLFADSVAGFVKMNDEEFTVSPISIAPGGTVAIRSASADPDQPDRPFCSEDLPEVPAQDPDGRTPTPAFGGGPPIDENTLLTAGVAIDATYEWYEGFPSLEAAQGYILNLMAQVSTIYEDEVNVEIEVPYLRVFTVPEDPYDDTTNPSTLLGNLRSEWNANQTGVSRTVTHLFSRRSSGGAGVAYIDTLCSNYQQPGNSFDYGVSTLSAHGGSWEKGLVAHELGHNFASVHTHCYSPPIDACANASGCYQGPIEQSVGTIMSYCNAITNEFHPRVEDEAIRPAAEQAYPTCVSLSVPGETPLPPENLSPF